MTPEHWQRVSELYHAVLEAESVHRVSLLESANPEVRREVESLLSSTGSGTSPLDKDALSAALDYLLASQLADGSWLVERRSFGFQPYFETGFPHGRNQFISAAATSWAVMALSAAVERN